MDQKATVESEVLAKKCVDVCEERKAVDVVLYDVRETSVLADFYLICSGTSRPHIRAISGALRHDLGQEGIHARVEGEPAGQWMVIDYGPVLVHIMDPERRTFYRLEELWQGERHSDAPTPALQTASDA